MDVVGSMAFAKLDMFGGFFLALAAWAFGCSLELPFDHCCAYSTVFGRHFCDVAPAPKGQRSHHSFGGIPICVVACLLRVVFVSDPPELRDRFLCDGAWGVSARLDDFSISVPCLPSFAFD